jgi:ligand-binding sensor domain-containing protein/anti-sigma regulatory factor (Ser/Thr protein kinase)
LVENVALHFLYLWRMRKCLSQIVVCFCLILYGIPSFSQSTQTIFYTTKDGLPSNSIYKCVLDNHGFLWIATENGLAKFDGKNFKTYTTAQGLTDNEITDIFIDSSQRMWVTPFRRTTAYYNPDKDRFENEDTDPELQKIELGNANRASVLQYGGVGFCNNRHDFFIYKNGKVFGFKHLLDATKTGAPEKIIEFRPGKYLILSPDTIRVFINERFTKPSPLNNKTFYSEFFNQTLYISTGSKISKYHVGDDGDVSLVLEKNFPFKIRIFCKAGKDLAVTTYNRTTYPVDTERLELKDPSLYNIAVRNVLEDKNGSTWISTIDRGLVKIQQKRISSFTITDKALNDVITQSFNAIAIIDKKIMIGNNYGEVLVYDGVYDIKRKALSPEKNMDGVIRKIVELKDKVYVACQTGSFLLDKKTMQIVRRFEGQQNASSKAALKLNDSVILLGSHSLLQKYNTVSGKVTDSVVKRITALGINQTAQIYVGSNDGLYRWDKDSLFCFGKTYKALSYRVNTIFSTADNLLWAGLGSDSLLVLKNDVLIKSIALGDIIPGNVCKSLYSNKPGVIWLGTNKGLNKIQYQLINNQLSFYNTSFGLSDGLIGEQVNDITIYKDTVYAATTGGISYLPANLNLPVTDITTFITRVSINGGDTMVKKNYTLPYDKNDISISFSGADLTGYYPLFEYRVNDGGWQKTDKNNIELRLASGSYNIQIRSMKRDGSPSSQTETISFYIKTPFWQSGVFWTIAVISFFIISFLILETRNKQKRKAAVEKVITEKKLTELEMQALKAQINPHFVFNCLNSIKGFIFDRDYAQADKYLDKFADLMRSTIDNSDAAIISLQSEINYLDNYLQLEKLRFEDKFDYKIEVATGIDKEQFFVPAMLLQPYVENAIRHGMRFLENKKGQININVNKENNFLVCEIDDNGIGREKAAALKSKMHVEYQSKGMNISRRRAELYNIYQQVTDKKDENGNATGTTIIVKIPLDFK